MYLPYLPDVPGGTQVGSSYLKAFASCPRHWFYRYAWPHRDTTGSLTGTGLVQDDAVRDAPLVAGSIFHLAIQTYLESGCRDGEDTGEYNIEAAVGMLDTLPPPTGGERQLSAWERSRQEARSLLLAYDSHFGPQGAAPLHPHLKVVCDQAGKPLIERPFVVPLGYRDYLYTCQADAVVVSEGIDLQVLEHKTSAPGMWVRNRLANISVDSQITGEIYALQHHFPEGDVGWERLDGARIHVYIKGWKPTSTYTRPVEWDNTRRNPHMLEQFRVRTISLLQDIDERMHQLDRAQEAGDSFDVAVAKLFPNTGMLGDACYAYRRPCDHMELCKMGHQPGVLRGYRPRATVSAASEFALEEQSGEA